MITNNKVAIYCRLSDEDRNKIDNTQESESIQNQKSMLVEYALERNWDITKIYVDEDYSGADVKRPAFNEMLYDAENRRFDVLLCKSLSRFARDITMVETYINGKFLEWGIRFISTVDFADSNNKGNRKSVQINSLINQWYLEDLSHNIKSVFKHKKQKGEFCAGFARYGYIKDPNNKNKLIIDPVASKIVKRIYNMYIEGNGQQYICKILNAENISSPTKYKQEQGYKYKNGSLRENECWKIWNPTTIGDILKDETFIGSVVQGKSEVINYKTKKRKFNSFENRIIVPNMHEPIIDIETWEKVQDIRKSRTRVQKTGERSIFAGKVYCAKCKSKMSISTYRYKNNLGRSYACKTHYVDESLCNNKKCINYKKLYKIVLGEIRNVIKDYCEFGKITIIEPQTTHQLENKIIIKDKKDEIKKLRRNAKQLYDDRLNGVISPEQYAEYNNEWQDKIKLLNGEIELLQREVEKKEKYTLNKEKILNKYKDLQELSVNVINEFIDSIHIGKYDEDSKKRQIEIKWNI